MLDNVRRMVATLIALISFLLPFYEAEPNTFLIPGKINTSIVIGPGYDSQKVVDSGYAYMSYYGDYRYIAAHNYYGFKDLDEVQVGDIAQIYYRDTRTYYKCIGKYYGKNTGNGIYYDSGKALKCDTDKEFFAYTCMQNKYHIILLRFKEIEN